MIGSLLHGPQQRFLESLTPKDCLRPGSKFKSSGFTTEKTLTACLLKDHGISTVALTKYRI